MKKYILIILLATSSLIASAQEAFIGEIRMFAGNFAPRGWMFCDGQTLGIRTNSALFSILGIQYGGDGVNTFNLPNLKGKVPIHPNYENYNFNSIGQTGGSETNQLTIANLPPHNHQVTITQQASTKTATSDDPTNRYPAATSINAYSDTANTAMAPITATVGVTGANIPVNNLQPYVVVNYIICVNGYYPSRE